jgi:pantetheine-phosphate adenylyltransferase
VIQRASRIFDRIVVGVGINPEKQPIFTLADRVQLVRESVADLPNVRVELFSGLSVAFVREQGAHVLLRGVRSLTDIDAEFTMTLANRKLDPSVETVFLMADAQYSHISSSLLKQITPLADDEALSKFVPPPVVAAPTAVHSTTTTHTTKRKWLQLTVVLGSSSSMSSSV